MPFTKYLIHPDVNDYLKGFCERTCYTESQVEQLLRWDIIYKSKTFAELEFALLDLLEKKYGIDKIHWGIQKIDWGRVPNIRNANIEESVPTIRKIRE
jgi:hypothetical protein